MTKLRRYVFLFLIVSLLVGCGKKTSSNKVEEVNDITVISTLQNEILVLENIKKTREIYIKGDGKVSDYSDDDKIRYGIEYKISQAGVPILTKEEIAELNSKGITGVASYVDLKDVISNIKNTFGENVNEYKTSLGCPKYTYDDSNKRFYIESKCETTDIETIISKIGKVTKKNNKYYVVIYAGLNDGTNIYSDFEKKNLIKSISVNESYTITEDNMNMFTKYTYTFEKDSDGKYIFKSVTKTK